MTGTTIKLENCSKTFADGTVALKKTSITVNRGEILSLLGPSGCGKTTLLRIIAGLETSDFGGSIKFDEDDVTQVPIERRAVGMVFQSYALFPNMSVYENIGYGLKVKQVPRSELVTRVNELLETCQLTEFSTRSIATLSGGQRQRVALARAIAPRPKVLLLDEPLSALDAALRDNLRDELSLLLRQFSITAVFVTHDQSEAMAIADRIAVMRGGQLVQIDKPEKLYNAPNCDFVAQFVGKANFLKGRVKGNLLQLAGGQITLPEILRPDHGVFIRPSSIRLSSKGSLCGKIVSSTFQGSHYRLGITGVTEDGLLFMEHDGDQVPCLGEEVKISLEISDLFLLPFSSLL